MALFGNVCVALHNLCIHFKVPNYAQLPVAATTQNDPDTGTETNLTRIGQKIRDNIKNSLRN